MAVEAVKQLPNQPRQDVRQADPDPFEDGVGYLKAKGWKCLGSPQGVSWLDPTRPDRPTEAKVKRQAPNWKTGALEDVIADDGTGKKRVVEQTVCDFPAEPMPIQQALLIQMERDRKAREKKPAPAAA